MLFHHDPMHTDTELDEIRAAVIDGWHVDPDRCLIAAEGAELVL